MISQVVIDALQDLLDNSLPGATLWVEHNDLAESTTIGMTIGYEVHATLHDDNLAKNSAPDQVASAYLSLLKGLRKLLRTNHL